MIVLTINGVSCGSDVKAPSSYSVAPNDVDVNSQRSTDGNMHRNVVNTKTTIDLTWDSISLSDASSLGVAIEDSSFDVEYYDPLDCDYKTINMYAGDKRFDCITLPNSNKSFWSVSFSLIEM